jgi:hypothetical protein
MLGSSKKNNNILPTAYQWFQLFVILSLKRSVSSRSTFNNIEFFLPSILLSLISVDTRQIPLLD